MSECQLGGVNFNEKCQVVGGDSKGEYHVFGCEELGSWRELQCGVSDR